MLHRMAKRPKHHEDDEPQEHEYETPVETLQRFVPTSLEEALRQIEGRAALLAQVAEWAAFTEQHLMPAAWNGLGFLCEDIERLARYMADEFDGPMLNTRLVREPEDQE
jgi:hypothetical protein